MSCILFNIRYNEMGGSMQRYFAKEKNGDVFILRADDLYHIRTVMRMKDNDKIYVVYEKETYICCLENVKKNIQIKIEKMIPNHTESKVEVTLFLPLLKEQKMDLVLQKATELGISRIIPMTTSRSIIRLNEGKEDKKQERWKRICKEASEQAHRDSIPEVSPIIDIMNVPLLSGLNLVCSTVEKEKNIKYILQNHGECGKINIVIGPEGGLSDKEEKHLQEIGYIPVTLGNNIMRVETVPIFVLSTINYEYME